MQEFRIINRYDYSQQYMKKIFVNGYGSIGSRIASFIADDPEVTLIGVGKYSADKRVDVANSRGFDVYVPEDRTEKFVGKKIAGTIRQAVRESDLVIDASPSGMGYENKKNLYDSEECRVIYQGGETIQGDNSVSQTLFNSRTNYDSALNADHVMQGSCNVTGMGRVLKPIQEKYNEFIKRFDVTLVRRWADLEQTEKEIPDTIEWTVNPHHQDDVKATINQDIPLFLRAIKVPTRQMHLHIMDIRFQNITPKFDEFLDIFKDEYGVAVLWTANGTRDVREYAQSMKFSFSDTNMIHIHANMLSCAQDTLQLMYSDDQTGIVIPENHILMQAMLFGKTRQQATKYTESLFHMDEKKRMLEKHFAKTS